jgi:hypothetical protein
MTQARPTLPSNYGGTDNILPSQVLTVNVTSAPLNVVHFQYVTLQVNWGINAVNGSAITGTSNATVQIQVSLDGINYANLTGALITISGTSGTTIITPSLFNASWVQLVVTANGVTGGNIEAFVSVR